ncbi:hypothetical protein PUR59_35920 [Streptomyces sp. SP18ES09]|uniref:hypothetical protein n=1 Tax=Streptomyces sp. SP18ES09 TaxID=3002532 RepID=UPI002E790D12|nr:hypothetical protein [Streptomyces sp. SP18ES09]MEE1820388.1 hypothetical protein [Streptomyces sp. SP18ES09]
MCAFFDPPALRRVPAGAYPLWDEALGLLNRDLAATLPDEEPLLLLGLTDEDENEDENEGEYVYVGRANGEWHGNRLEPDSAGDPLDALAAVADAAQDTVTELLWRAWPLCAEHNLGMHVYEAEGQLSWWCSGGMDPRHPAHLRAAVGGLDALLRPSRPHHRRRSRP